MSVSKIFITLIIIVACVAIGALVLNILLPNVTATLVNAVENMIYQATKLQFDFNGDGTTGSAGTEFNAVNGDTDAYKNTTTVGVDGFN